MESRSNERDTKRKNGEEGRGEGGRMQKDKTPHVARWSLEPRKERRKVRGGYGMEWDEWKEH